MGAIWALAALLASLPVWWLINRVRIARIQRSAGEEHQQDAALFQTMRALAYCELPADAFDGRSLNSDDPANECLLHLGDGVCNEALDRIEELREDSFSKVNPFFWYIASRVYRDHGKVAEAVAAARTSINVPDSETRGIIQGWSLLREYGEEPDEATANEVLGLIVEENSVGGVHLVAAYADGDARILWQPAGGIIGDMRGRPAVAKAAQKLVRCGSELSNLMTIAHENPLASKGQARISILTRAGRRELSTESSFVKWGDKRLQDVHAATQELITVLRKVKRE